MTNILDEEALIKQLIQSSSQSQVVLGILFENYSGKLFAYLKRKMQVDEAIIDDVIQETFISAAKNIENLKEPSKFYSWLVTIARNKMIDVINFNKKFCDIQEWINIKEEEEDDNHIDGDNFYNTIDLLPNDEQDIVLMKIILELNFNEISDILNISISATKMRYYRSLEKLKTIV